VTDQHGQSLLFKADPKIMKQEQRVKYNVSATSTLTNNAQNEQYNCPL